MPSSRRILLAAIALLSCTPAHHPQGAADCDPTAVSDNGCPDGQSCTLTNVDKASGERFLKCEPAGGAGEWEACGPQRLCRPGHLCNITPGEAPADAAAPGVCVRMCNTNFPVCPGSACHELAGYNTQWLSVDGVRYGMCSGAGQGRSQFTKNPGAAEQPKPAGGYQRR